MSRVYELAKKYYPHFWGIKKLHALVVNGSLTPEEYKEITGEDYEEN